jgi:hypothetical protein
MNIEEAAKKFEIVYEFMRAILSFCPSETPLDKFPFPDGISWGKENPDDNDDIHLEWDREKHFFHGIISLGPDGSGGAYLEWNNKAHHLQKDWTGNINSSFENGVIAEMIYRVGLRYLLKQFRDPAVN